MSAANRSVPILMYHQVLPQPPAAFRKYCVTPEAFRAQMRWLALAGYTTVGLDTLRDQRAGRGRLPRRPVVITFDDGFQGCVDHAVPVLHTYGFTATFYLVAGLMGQTSYWLIAERGVAFPLMNWHSARALARAGFTCGAHTLHHPRLATLSAAACWEELHGARGLLEAQLGRAVPHLAYPFGSYNDDVRSLAAQAGYQTACSVRIGFSPMNDDLLALHRIPVDGQDTLVDFICRLYTTRTVRELLRDAVMRARGMLRPHNVEVPQ